MEPIWQLLRPKTNDGNWTAAHKGCLRSVMANRQFPQTRVMKCGWSSHDRCLLCLSEIVDAESGRRGMPPRTVRDAVVATPEQLDNAPRGDLIHRSWACRHTEALRESHARKSDVRTAKEIEVRGHPSWEKGLTTRPSLPLRKKTNAETATKARLNRQH